MSVEAIAEEACKVTTDHYTVCTYASGRRLNEFNRVLPGEDRRRHRRCNTITYVTTVYRVVSLSFYYYKITL
jgi:hypothetical protein